MNKNDNMSGTREEKIQKVAKLIKDVRVAMFTTVRPDGSLHSRPMATQEVEFDGDLWFFTHRNTPKAEELSNDTHVSLTYTDTSDNRWVALTGRAFNVDDKAKAKDLWNPALKAWFPQGLDDPQLSLIRVEVNGAEYWDSPSNLVVHLAGMAKAALTGEPLRNPGEHATINLAM